MHIRTYVHLYKYWYVYLIVHILLLLGKGAAQVCGGYHGEDVTQHCCHDSK